jgi:dolichol-phosphate mannosyltransferase
MAGLFVQPKYILDFVDKQAATGADIVSGTRYTAGGGVFGWDFRRKLISCGANILALTLLQPKVDYHAPKDLDQTFAASLP